MNQCRHYCRQASRTNAVGIQMLSNTLHKQVFGDIIDGADAVSPETVRKIHEGLKKHGLAKTPSKSLEEVELSLPPMQGIQATSGYRRPTLLVHIMR